MSTVLDVAANVLVILGVLVMTIGVVGLFRMPDVYTQLHAASKAVFLGVIAFCGASMLTQGGATAARAALIGVFLILTTPVASHVIAQAANRTDEPIGTDDAVDEMPHPRPRTG